MINAPVSMLASNAISLAAAGKYEEAMRTLNDLNASPKLLSLVERLYSKNAAENDVKPAASSNENSKITKEGDWLELLMHHRVREYHESAAYLVLHYKDALIFSGIKETSIREGFLGLLTPPKHELEETTLTSAIAYIDSRMNSGLLRSAGIGYMAIHLLWPYQHAWPLYNWKRAIDKTHPRVADLVGFITGPAPQ
jgi:hypothetical protein